MYVIFSNGFNMIFVLRNLEINVDEINLYIVLNNFYNGVFRYMF